MRRSFLIVAIAILALTGCVHHTPFEEEYYFQAMGEEGELVVTADLDKIRGSNKLNAVPTNAIIDRADRVSASLTPSEGTDAKDLSTYSIYGALEGNYGKLTGNTALSWSKEFDKASEYGITFYRSKEYGIEAGVPKSGILLFSNSSYANAYMKTISNRVTRIPDSVASRMASAHAALFVDSPKALFDIGFELPDSVLAKTDTAVFLVAEENDAVYLSAEINMADMQSARTLCTLLRNQTLQSLRRAGITPDFKDLSARFFYSDKTVVIDHMALDDEMAAKTRALIENAAGGLF